MWWVGGCVCQVVRKISRVSAGVGSGDQSSFDTTREQIIAYLTEY